jgi:DNA-binding PucR family transcriptional regulator
VPESRRAADVAGSLAALGDGWIATTAPAPGLLGTAGAVREATAALAVARRAGRIGTLVPAGSLALERALLAEPDLLRAAVERELGPLLAAPRGAGLADTMEAYLAERENVRAAARRLGIAPRTVAYRLERIERLLGGRLDAARRARLATALFARRLLGDDDPAAGPTAAAGSTAAPGQPPSGAPGGARRAAAARSR